MQIKVFKYTNEKKKEEEQKKKREKLNTLDREKILENKQKK